MSYPWAAIPAWDPAANIVIPSNYLLYEVAPDGDAYLSVTSPNHVYEPILLRVSTEALQRTSEYFYA